MREIRHFQEARLAWELERDELQREVSQLKQSQPLQRRATVAGPGDGALPNNHDELLKTIAQMKLADQNRRLAWKAEMQNIEIDLNKKQELEEQVEQLQTKLRGVHKLEEQVEQLRTELRGAHTEIQRLTIQGQQQVGRPDEKSNDQPLRDILSFFLTHVQDPLKKIRIACGDSAGFHFQVRLDPVCAADRDYTAQLVKVVESLRASAKTLDQSHAPRCADSLSQSVPGYQVGVSQSARGPCRPKFDDRVDPLSFSVPGWQVSTMTRKPHSGCVPVVDSMAAAHCKGNVFDNFLDQTAENMGDWLLSKFEPKLAA